MDSCIVQSGTFTSTGAPINLPIRSDVDWMMVTNYSQTGGNQATGRGYSYIWQRGYPLGGGLITYNTDGALTLQQGTIASGGFTLVDQGNQAYLSSGVAFTGISNATQPVITTGSTAGLSDGDIVILSQTAAQRTAADATALCGIPFQIDTIVANTSFRIANALSQAPGAGVAAAAGSWRKVNISSIFYPQFRYIVNVDTSSATAPVFRTSVNHGYQVGQLVYFTVQSDVNGMVQLNTLSAPITAVTSSTFTVSLDTTGFSAFVFPTAAQATAAFPYSNATVSPAGMDSAVALNAGVDLISDATNNISIIGINLGTGVGAGGQPVGYRGPSGIAGDTMYYIAGKSSIILNGPLFQ